MALASSLEDIVPLSPLQEGLLFAGSADPGGRDMYVVHSVLDIDGDIDPARLRAAAQALLQRHTSLRTCFRARRDGRLAGLVVRNVEVPWTDLDVLSLDPAERDRAWSDQLDDVAGRRFDVAAAPLVRFLLCRTDKARWKLVLVFHHAIIDGWSTPIVVRELFALYAGDTLPPVVPYKNYLKWIGRQDSTEAAELWRRQLADVVEPTLIAPSGSTRTAHGTERLAVELSPDVRENVSAAARRRGVTTSVLLQCAWALVLCRTLGRSDVVFGATVSGRAPDLPGVESMVGLFINTVPVRMSLRPEDGVDELLARAQHEQTAVMNHQYVSLSETTAHAPVAELFDSLVIFESYPVARAALDDVFARSGLVLSGTAGEDTTNFPVTIFAGHSGDALTVSLAYSPDVVSSQLGDALARRLSAALTELCAPVSRPVRDITLASPAERAITVRSARPSRGTDLDLDARMAAVAAISPHRRALVCGSESVTYGEFDSRVGTLAHRLAGEGACPGTTVALAVRRSIDVVVALFAVLRTGAAYLPIDPTHPQDRLDYILADAGVRFVLVGADVDLPVPAGVRRIEVGAGADSTLPAGSQQSRRSDDTAYLIYTSGTTGTPKGVVVPTGALVNFVDDMAQRLRVDENRTMLAVTTVSFDIAVLELIVPLTRGAAVIVATDEQVRDPHAARQLATAHGVNIAQATPSWWSSIVAAADSDASDGEFPAGVDVLVGGEAVPQILAGELVARATSVRNMYGPTETTVWSTTADIGDDVAVAIGGPIAATSLRVLDGFLTPTLPGAPGELYIGGAGVTHGYHNKSALTASRFVADPYGPPGARVYRTGDVVRANETGELVYLTRSDNQVKIRGYRVEPAEVETALGRVDGVEAAVVVAREDAAGTQRLVAYVVGDVDPAASKISLQESLPSYMVPSFIVVLPELPRTANGKTDRKALPDPSFDGGVVRAPRDDRERALIALFTEVLGVPLTRSIGIDDDFFDLGGHSLSATRLVARVAAQLDTALPVREVFDHPTVAQLARRLDSAGSALPPITRADSDGSAEPAPLSYAQQRLWFLFHLDGASGMYNVPFAVRTSETIDVGGLRGALRDVADLHEVLRTVVDEVDGAPIARVVPRGTDITVTVEHVESDALADAVRSAADHPFDLAVDLPMRAHILSLPDGDSVFVLVLHHIATDEWSGPVLLHDLADAYQQRCAGAAPQKSRPKTTAVGYRDYAVWQRAITADLDAGPLAVQRTFWTRTLADLPDELRLPTDRPRQANGEAHGEGVTVELDPKLAEALTASARAHKVTPFMFMHAATAVLLAKHGAGTDIAIGTPVSGRVDPALDRMVGMFVNTLVLRTDLGGNPSFATVLARVKNTDLAALSHQDLPFDVLVDLLDPPRAYGRHPLFQVLVDYQRVSTDDTPQLFGSGDQRVEYGTGGAKFDLAFALTDNPANASAHITIDYSATLFDRETVDAMADRLVAVLSTVTAEPKSALSDIDITLGGERVWNGDPVHIAPDTTMTSVMRETARTYADAVAVVAGDRSLTFAELDTASNQLARSLLHRGVRPEEAVGVRLPRSVDSVVAFWAVSKVGALFVPLDPSYPESRIAAMIDDADICTVLDEQFLAQDGVDGSPLAPDEVDSPTPHQGLYVIFTSGSTGRPKGVVVPHAAVVGLLAAYRKGVLDSARPGSRVLSMYSTSFDSSLALMLWMFDGHTLHIASEQVASDATAVVDYVNTHRIDHVDTVPTMMAALLDVGLLDGPRPPRSVTVGGDAVRGAVWDRLAAADVVARNFYGPTENTVDSTFATILAEDGVNIGRPLPGRGVAVYDQWLTPVADGVTGELYVSGTGIARGYIGAPAATATRFVADPAGTGTRMYRTGDMVRRAREDGPLQFVGRVDHQVKIRGYRIELGEIENALARCTGVRDAVAVVHSAAGVEPRLICYLTGTDLDEGRLRVEMADKVPAQSVPTHFEVVEEFATTSNGKIDRTALPQPDFARAVSSSTPSTETEMAVCAVFARTLGLPAVGVDDDFFALGGDSIVSIQVVSRLREKGVVVTARQVFEGRTPAALALVAATAGAGAQVERASAIGDVPLTPIVRDALARGPIPNRFCQARLLTVPASMTEADLTAAVAAVLDVHHILRSTFTVTEDGPRWTVPSPDAGPAESLVRTVDLTDRDAPSMADAADEAYDSLDLAAGRLLAVVWFDAGPSAPGRLLIAVHHLAMDGVSWRILVPDLQAAYTAVQAGSPSALDEPRTSFRDWALSAAGLACDKSIAGDLPRWLSVSNDTRIGSRPLDPAVDTIGSTRLHTVTVPHSVTFSVLTDIPTLFFAGVEDVLLTALALAAARTIGVRSLAVDLEGHGRSEHLVAGAELSRTIGWFTTMYPVPLDVSDIDVDDAFDGGPSAGSALKRIKDLLRALPEERIGFGLLRFGDEAAGTAFSNYRAPEVVFNYLGRTTLGEASGTSWTSAPEEGPFGGALDPRMALDHLLEINAATVDTVDGPQLRCEFSAAAGALDAPTVERWGQAFVDALIALAHHARTPDAGGRSSSDLTYTGLALSELADLEAELDLL